MDCGCTVIYDADSGLCLSYVQTKGPKQNLDHRSFFSLDRYVHEFIQTISFSERSLFKLRCETVIGIVLCCCHQACCLLYFLGEINNAIHTNQFTFEPLHLCFRMWLLFRIEQKYWRIDGFGEKQRHGGPVCIPLFTSSSLSIANKKNILKRRYLTWTLFYIYGKLLFTQHTFLLNFLIIF